MTRYHAVLTDECGSEFGVDLTANTRLEALTQLREDYPESRVIQIEDDSDTAKRQHDIYTHINAGGDWDDEGRPIFYRS